MPAFIRLAADFRMIFPINQTFLMANCDDALLVTAANLLPAMRMTK